jgi:POT family proton-dependent oligopeptide transporter
MAIGCMLCALAYLIMAGAAFVAHGDSAHWLWLIAYFIVLTLGELYLSPIGLSLVSKVAPVRMVSMLMGLWLATDFAGNLLAGWLGTYYSTMPKTHFFLMIAVVAAVASLVIFAFKHPLRAALRE